MTQPYLIKVLIDKLYCFVIQCESQKLKTQFLKKLKDVFFEGRSGGLREKEKGGGGSQK